MRRRRKTFFGKGGVEFKSSGRNERNCCCTKLRKVRNVAEFLYNVRAKWESRARRAVNVIPNITKWKN